ncbi:MAG: hypothetical protein PWQ88_1172 [Candidatus Methanomethylophilaceae archaeon]|nr:hypothetical protein [Candidatus Methanomethylophilaceae archaeon]
MANFGLDELYLVNPCEIGDEAYSRSKHGKDVLVNAKIVDELDDALQDCFLIVGTSGIITEGEKNYIRVPISAKELAEGLEDYNEKVAILFGREDQGLYQDELAKCDILVTIPSNKQYPVLNLSHAVTIVIYELFQKGTALKKPHQADRTEKEMLLRRFDELLDAIDYPPHRKERTSIMFRRMVGRAVPTKWEFYTLMGVIGDAAERIRRKE